MAFKNLREEIEEEFNSYNDEAEAKVSWLLTRWVIQHRKVALESYHRNKVFHNRRIPRKQTQCKACRRYIGHLNSRVRYCDRSCAYQYRKQHEQSNRKA